MMRRLCASVLMAVVVVLTTVPVAMAHDELVSSIPADGYTVNELPAAARLTFAEETHAADVTVTAAGRSLPVSDVPGDVHQVSVDLVGVPATGTVQLDWRAVDEHDGHVTSGVVAFHLLDHPDADAPTAAPTSEGPTPTNGLVATIPTNGYTVTQLPSIATFTFTDETRAAQVTVRSGDRALPVTAVPGSTHEVSVSLVGVAATESVRLTWKRVDPRGHATSGAIAFHVIEHTASAVPGPGGSTSSGQPRHLHALSVTAHLAGYLAMAVLLGGLFFVSVLWPAGARDRRTRMLLGIATVVGALSAIALVYVATQQVAPLPFREAIAEHFGRVSVAVALMWLLASVVVVSMMQQPDVVRRAAWRFTAVFAAGGLIRTIGMSAHGTQGTHPTLGLFIDFLHLTAVSAWVGGLAVASVGLLPRRQLGELEVVLPKFSRVAATSVLLVITSGVLLAWQVIGSFHGLTSTHYGHILIVKVALVGFVLLGAVASKRWVERTLAAAVSSDRSSAIGSLVASVSAETVLVIAVLGAASVLVTSSPGL